MEVFWRTGELIRLLRRPAHPVMQPALPPLNNEHIPVHDGCDFPSMVFNSFLHQKEDKSARA